MNVGVIGMIATALLGSADDEPMQDYEVALLNKIVQAYTEGGELPEEDIKLALVVMCSTHAS